MRIETVDGHIIQILGQGATVTRTFTGTSARVQLASGWKLVELWSDQDCYVLWGDSTVTASATTSRPLTARIPIQVIVSTDNAYIAVIRIAVSGTLSITNIT